MSFNALRKTVGNFIAGNDTSSDKSSQQSSGGASSSGASGSYDEKNAPHTKLPVDTYYYPGTRYWYYLMDIEVTRVGHSGTMGYITGSTQQQSDITKFYGEIYKHYAHGWMLNTFYEVPGIGKIGWSASSSPFQFVYLKPIANAPVAHTWDLKIGKCYIHTQLVTGVIGRQNHNVANTTGVTNMITQFAATGGRMIGIEFTGERKKQSGLALGKSDLMGVDLLFNVPKHPNPILYSYQCVNVPVRIMYLGTGKLVKVECEWMQNFARHLQQGWKLIDIFWDQSKKSHGDLSLSGDHNSIWFFEKETSKLKVNAPAYEGTIVEFKHTVKIGLGSTKPKSDWTPMFTEMGNRGWELACMLESPEIITVGLGTITYKVYFFFQRPIMQPPPGGYPPQAYPQAYPVGPQPHPNAPQAYPPQTYPTQPGYPQAPPPYTQGQPQGASAYPYPQASAPPGPARPPPPGSSVPPGVPHKR